MKEWKLDELALWALENGEALLRVARAASRIDEHTEDIALFEEMFEALKELPEGLLEVVK